MCTLSLGFLSDCAATCLQVLMHAEQLRWSVHVWCSHDRRDGVSATESRRAVSQQPWVVCRRYGKGRLLALDIATGLAFLHAHDIIHFDIKSKCATTQKPLASALNCLMSFRAAFAHHILLATCIRLSPQDACGIV